MFFQKCFVELLSVRVNPPRAVVDHDFDKVDLGNGNVLTDEMRVQCRTHHRSIAIAVEQVERAIAVKILLVVLIVHRDIERAFAAFIDRKKRRGSAKTHADIGVRFAVDHHRCGHFNIGRFKVLEFFLPVLCFKGQENSSQNTGIEQPFRCVVRHVRRRNFRPLRTLGSASTSPATGRPTTTTPTTLAVALQANDFFSRQRSFGFVEPAVLVGIELFYEININSVGPTDSSWPARLCLDLRRGQGKDCQITSKGN